MSFENRIQGGVPVEFQETKYHHYKKLDFLQAVGGDVIYAVRRSSAKAYVEIREYLDASSVVDFNKPRNRLMLLSLVQAELITAEKAVEIMGATHE